MYSNTRFKRRLLGLLFIAGCLSIAPGCGFIAGASRQDPEQAVVEMPLDELYNRYPQLLTLERTLDRASAHFYFGEYELARSSAGHLIALINDIRATHPDPSVCPHLDYLEDRAMSLLQRMTDDELELSAGAQVTALIDSLARSVVVEEEIEIELNDKTNHWLAYFKGSGRKHFSKWLARVSEHRAVIEPILVEVGVPRDLLYLAVIESGLNLSARSYMKAVGPWQFMAGTAQLFGLRVNWWIDERKDLVAATYAAANYLKYLHEVFGSWPLALAAYNAGEHRVAHAISRQRTIDYWRLNLPAQTEWFVPKFMAALAIGRDPEAHGFERPGEAPVSFDIIEVERPVELRAIANAAGCSLNDFKQLNPQFKRWCTPPDMVVEAKVPRGAGIAAAEHLSSMKSNGVATILQHRVKRGETLSSIAAQYEVSIKDLKRTNEMGKSSKIRAGSMLLVPVKDLRRSARLASRPSYRSPERLPSKASLPLLAAADGERVIRYIVKRNDTLVKIAERFNTHLGELREWNKLDLDSRIATGDTLVIPLASGRSSSQESSETASAGGAGRMDAAAAPPESDETKWLTHVVRKGDTLTSISKRYKARLSDVLAWNDKTKRSKLYPGEKIRIRVKAQEQ